MFQEVQRGPDALERMRLRRRNPLAHHQVFGKGFTGFDLGGVLGGTEDLEFAFSKQIRDAQRQRRFGADHGEIHGFLFGERFQARQVRRRNRHTRGLLTDSRVPGRAIELADPGT